MFYSFFLLLSHVLILVILFYLIFSVHLLSTTSVPVLVKKSNCSSLRLLIYVECVILPCCVILQQALQENRKIRETEEKIRRAKEAKEKSEREKQNRQARQRALVDITTGKYFVIQSAIPQTVYMYKRDMICLIDVGYSLYKDDTFRIINSQTHLKVASESKPVNLWSFTSKFSFYSAFGHVI